MRSIISRQDRMGLAALLLAPGCDLAEVEIIAPPPALAVAEATAVVTVDPANPSQSSTHIVAILTDYPEGEHPRPLHGATVRVTGESEQSMQLREEPDPAEDCVNRDFFGSCYQAAAPSGTFTPGEELHLEVKLPDGGTMSGVSHMPGMFSPTGLSLEGGRCRLTPNTNQRITWPRVEGAVAFVAEAVIDGLGELSTDDDPLYLTVAMIGGDLTGISVPRGFLYELNQGQNDAALARVLHAGLPAGATADIALGAVDRNWTNWIREGRIHVNGEVRTPSVFGDGTGMFGTAVRWKIGVESREAGREDSEEEFPLCGGGID